MSNVNKLVTSGSW